MFGNQRKLHPQYEILNATPVNLILKTCAKRAYMLMYSNEVVKIHSKSLFQRSTHLARKKLHFTDTVWITNVVQLKVLMNPFASMKIVVEYHGVLGKFHENIDDSERCSI